MAKIAKYAEIYTQLEKDVVKLIRNLLSYIDKVSLIIEQLNSTVTRQDDEIVELQKKQENSEKQADQRESFLRKVGRLVFTIVMSQLTTILINSIKSR
jgi:phage-related tail protein